MIDENITLYNEIKDTVSKYLVTGNEEWISELKFKIDKK